MNASGFVLRFFLSSLSRSSRPGVFLGKGVLKISCKFTEHLNLVHIFRTSFPKNTSWRLLLIIISNIIGILISWKWGGLLLKIEHIWTWFDVCFDRWNAVVSFFFCLLTSSVLVLRLALELFSWLSNKTVLGGDCTIPFGHDEILSCFAGIPAVL